MTARVARSPERRRVVASIEDTRGRLLAAARDAYLEVGPTAFSLREVARRVGVSAPAVYRHFDDKAALLTAVCGEGFQVFSSYLMRSLGEATPAARMRASSAEYLRFGLEHPRDYRFIFMSPTEGIAPPPPGPDTHRRGTAFQFLVDRVRECMEAGVVARGDAEEVAIVIWSHVHGLVSLRLAGHLGSIGDDEAFTAFFARSSDRLLSGLASPQPR